MRLRGKINVCQAVPIITILGIFSNLVIESLCILINIIFIASVKSNECTKISKRLAVNFLLVSVISSIIIFLLNYSFGTFIRQIILLIYFIFGYYVIFRNIINKRIEYTFSIYLKFSYYISLFGLLQFLIYFGTGVDISSIIFGYVSHDMIPRILRITSIMREPSYLAAALLPAVTYCINNYQTYKKYFYVITAVVFMTFSTTAIVMFVFIFIQRYIKNLRFVIIPALACMAILLFSNITFSETSKGSLFEDSLKKLDDINTGLSVKSPDGYELLNLSSYATLSNLWVSRNAPDRLFGTGLGTHEQSYLRLYKSDFQYYGLNSKDAYSLGIRLFSEFGYVGLILLFIFIISRLNRTSDINIASLIIIISYIIKGGHYTMFGVIFWFMMFHYTGTLKLNYRIR